MGKKIEVSIDFLKELNLSQEVINKIIKDSNPDYWVSKLPNDFRMPCINNSIIDGSQTLSNSIQYISFLENNKPEYSFFSMEDAKFIREKCDLLVEMSNFAFVKNSNWEVDWNNKEQKKYGIILKDGVANVNENDIFNLYIFGIALKNRVLALEMLDEFKIKIEKYFNKQFNSVKNFDVEDGFDYEIKHVKDKSCLVIDGFENNEKKIRSKIKPSDYDKLIRMVSIENKSIIELCKEFNVSRSCIENVCLKLNLETKVIKKNHNKIDKNEFEYLIKEGYTIKDLANYFECSEAKISNFKKKYALNVTKVSNDINQNEFESLIKKGYTITDLANHFKCSRSKITDFKKRNGLIRDNGFNNINKKEFLEACENYNNNKLERNQIMRKFGIKTIGNFYTIRKKLIS